VFKGLGNAGKLPSISLLNITQYHDFVTAGYTLFYRAINMLKHNNTLETIELLLC